MDVPITSDFVGYAAFWSRWLVRFILVLSSGFLAVLLLLYLIWRK